MGAGLRRWLEKKGGMGQLWIDHNGHIMGGEESSPYPLSSLNGRPWHRCTLHRVNPKSQSTYDRQFIRHIFCVVLSEGHNLQQSAEQSGAGRSRFDSSGKR